jgi:hypothetical protein
MTPAGEYLTLRSIGGRTKQGRSNASRAYRDRMAQCFCRAVAVGVASDDGQTVVQTG